MVEAVCITDPILLQSASQTQHLKLVLLQPLANFDTLQPCRIPNTRLPDDYLKHEYLDILPLSRAWRQALINLPPFSKLTFDLALPRNVPDDRKADGPFQNIHWDTAMPQQPSLGVHVRQVELLVKTIAAVTRMRADVEGIDVRFDVEFGENEGLPLKAVRGLGKQLSTLAEMETSGIEDWE